jgi:hypothetical protein
MSKAELKSSHSDHDFASLLSPIESIHQQIQTQTAKLRASNTSSLPRLSASSAAPLTQ